MRHRADKTAGGMIELPTHRRDGIGGDDNDDDGGLDFRHDPLGNAEGDGTNSVFGSSIGCIILVVIILYMSGGGGKGGDVVPSDIPNGNFGGQDGANDGGGSIVSDEGMKSSSRQHRFPPKLPEKHRQIQPRPNNLNILFIGDTVTRYQYLSLVYFLRWGRWFDPGYERSNLVNEWSFDNPFHKGTYNEFFFQTNIMLQPYELCDCHKTKDKEYMRYSVIENRYYHDPTLNNTVTFLHAFGDELAMHGRVKATDVYTEEWKWSTKEKGLITDEDMEGNWSYDTWDAVISNYVSQIRPSPEYAVLNAGRWSNSFGPGGSRSSGTLAGALVSAKLNKKWWRTTTYTRSGELLNQDLYNNKETDEYMCSQLFHCLNVSWTEQVPENMYWDETHFHEPVYRVINEEMLHSIDVLPEGYLKYDKELLTTGKVGPTDPPTESPTRRDTAAPTSKPKEAINTNSTTDGDDSGTGDTTP